MFSNLLLAKNTLSISPCSNLSKSTLIDPIKSSSAGISPSFSEASEKLGDIPALEDLIGSIKVLLDKFEQGEIDKVFLASNRFENTMTQQPEIRQLLPLLPEDMSSGNKGNS